LPGRVVVVDLMLSPASPAPARSEGEGAAVGAGREPELRSHWPGHRSAG
jgi:hypothetical protein